MLTVSQLFIFPVKSLAGFSVPTAVVTNRGLEHDRRWMLVDAHNQFLTLREYPKMALLHTALTNSQLVVTSSEQPASPLTIPFETNKHDGEDVTIWNATVRANSEGKEAADWFSGLLGVHCKLVFMPESSHRPVDTTSGYRPAGKFTSFADAYPFLLLGEASMNDLNSRLPEPVDIRRFRPNIVFSGGTSYQEDKIEHFTINGIPFTGLENCARCKIPNVDPATGTFSATNQPLKTLASYRNVNRNIIFGRNTVHGGTGTIRVGDALILQ